MGFAAASPGGKAADQALANLQKLRSFEFSQTILSREMPEVNGQFLGTVILPDTEERSGFWLTPGGKIPVEAKARGEIEYALEESAWTTHARGEETEFLTQLERALAFDSFQAPQKTGNYLEIRFVPNLLFLNPMGTKRLSATIRILRDRMLPEEITARSPDSSVFWQVKLSDFDQAGPIAFPFVRQWCISLTPDPRPPTPAFKDTLALRSRFREAGYETRFGSDSGSLKVFLEQKVHDDLLRFLIAPGQFTLGLGRLTDAVPSAAGDSRRVALAGDTTKAMVIERTILGQKDWTAITLADSLAEPLFELSLTKQGQAKLAGLAALEKSGSDYALVLDDRVVARGPVEHRSNPARLMLSATGNKPLLKQVGNIFRSGSLTSLYRLDDVSQIKPSNQ